MTNARTAPVVDEGRMHEAARMGLVRAYNGKAHVGTVVNSCRK